jgi:hypothetical protein
VTRTTSNSALLQLYLRVETHHQQHPDGGQKDSGKHESMRVPRRSGSPVVVKVGFAVQAPSVLAVLQGKSREIPHTIVTNGIALP